MGDGAKPGPAKAKQKPKRRRVKPVYTLGQYARITGQPRSSVYEQAKKGQLHTVMLAGRPMVPLTVLVPILESIRLAEALEALQAA